MQGSCFLSSPSQLTRVTTTVEMIVRYFLVVHSPVTSFLSSNLFPFLPVFFFICSHALTVKKDSYSVAQQAWLLENSFSRAALHPLFAFFVGQLSHLYLTPSPCTRSIFESPFTEVRWPEGPLGNNFCLLFSCKEQGVSVQWEIVLLKFMSCSAWVDSSVVKQMLVLSCFH